MPLVVRKNGREIARVGCLPLVGLTIIVWGICGGFTWLVAMAIDWALG